MADAIALAVRERTRLSAGLRRLLDLARQVARGSHPDAISFIVMIVLGDSDPASIRGLVRVGEDSIDVDLLPAALIRAAGRIVLELYPECEKAWLRVSDGNDYPLARLDLFHKRK